MNVERRTPRTPSSFRRAVFLRQNFVLALVAAAALAGQARADFDVDFDDFGDGEIEIVNGRIVPKNRAPKEVKKLEPDPAGDQVLELTDGSQLHGRLVALGKNEVVWKRADATEQLTFAPQEVRRLILGNPTPSKESKANATLKLNGSDWMAGELTGFKDGKFSICSGAETALEIPREKVEWLALAPKLPPDAYEGPFGLMGLAGWDTMGEGTSGWEYSDGALVARNSTNIQRRFEALPNRLDLQFTAGDGGANNRSLALSITPDGTMRSYSPGACYLRFSGNQVNLSLGTQGGGIKSMSAQIPADKDEKKTTRYRLLYDRKDGRLVILVNGKQVVDWDLPETKEVSSEGAIIWAPSPGNSNLAWTLAQVRLQPWDGTLTPDGKEEEAGKDLLQSGSAAREAGALQEISPETVKFEGKDVARKDPIFVRLANKTPVEPPANTVARVWLAGRGEFDVTGIGFRDGVLKVRTAFAGDLALPLGTVRALEFPHKAAALSPTAKAGGDTLIFKGGDQLKGTLIAASHNQPLRWKPLNGDKPVEFTAERIAGVLLGNRSPAAAAEAAASEQGRSAVARFHNGDWLPGRVQALDGQVIRLKTFGGTELAIKRETVKTLYFAANGEAPVWDGAGDREVWMKGLAIPGYMNDSNSRTRADEKKASPWRYLDGTFTLAGVANSRYGSGPSLGRILEKLPEKVDISFELSTERDGANYVFQFFFDTDKQGIMVQGGWDNAYIYDMSTRPNGGVGFNNQPQQLDFSETVGSGGNRRHFRFLANRQTSQMWMYVNGHLVGALNRRASARENRKMGQGFSIFPTGTSVPVSVSKLWVAPWSGALPEFVATKKKTDEAEAAADAGKIKEGKQEPANAVAPAPAAAAVAVAPANAQKVEPGKAEPSKAEPAKGEAAKVDPAKPADPALAKVEAGRAIVAQAAKMAVQRIVGGGQARVVAGGQVQVIVNGRIVNRNRNSEEKPPAEVVAQTEDSVALANGDETRGSIVRGTGDTLVLKCDVGEIEVPIERAVLVDFAGKAPVATGTGDIRLRFAGKGALTVQSLRFEGDKVICQSAAVGELTFPLAQLTEIVFRPGVPAVSVKAPAVVPAGPAVPRSLEDFLR